MTERSPAPRLYKGIFLFTDLIDLVNLMVTHGHMLVTCKAGGMSF